jgi:protein involved in polysaccharide export with SLBB domain
MIRFKFIVCGIFSALVLNSCSNVLEPVSFFIDEQNIEKLTEQEEFEIEIQSLTFDTAKKANNAPYPRRLILSGIGSKANVLDEAVFLNSRFPKSSKNHNYVLGIGDEISLKLLKEFNAEITQWPNAIEKSDYILGTGDKLIFTQSNDSKSNIISYSLDNKMIPTENNDVLISTEGVIGSNGNILLFGLGNILAANKTLEDIRTEIRNTLIRNGQAPNFQLEISDFKSQKFFINTGNDVGRYPLSNISKTLQELASETGISDTDENFALIKLTRNNQEFRFTAEQLFDSTAPKIIIQNNDLINIQIAPKFSNTIKSVVGLKGNIILGELGSITALNRTLDDIYEEISNILISKGNKPSFQLELTKFASKKAYFIQKNVGSLVIPLTNSKITLRELILKNEDSKISTTGLSIITLKRNKQVYQMTEDQILNPKTQDIWIMDEDQIEVESLEYKDGQVFALSGAGNAQVVPISPSRRETLADVLFVAGGPLNNLLAKRSEVYLLRGQNPSAAYHLDAQNVSRILVAAKTELRPNDIVYVADRPIISFSRTLSELLPLRILLRDIKNNNIP